MDSAPIVGAAPAAESCPSCVAYKPAPESPTGRIAQASQALETLVKNMPEGENKKGLQSYLRIVRPTSYLSDREVAGSNRGLQAFLDEKMARPQNACLMSAAVNFYEEVEKVSRSRAARPNLDQTAGEGENRYLKAGWLWELALKHAHQDANAAMTLIGMCGHDDRMQSIYPYRDKSAKTRDELMEKRQRLKSEQRDLLNDVSVPSDPERQRRDDRAKELRESIAELDQHLQNGQPRDLMCPDDFRDFFLAGSLGVDADIPVALKEKIKTVQGEASRVPPSKSYHVYGAALMVCQMVEDGVAPDKAEQIEVLASRLYRGIRVCQVSSDLLQKKESLRKAYLADQKGFLPSLDEGDFEKTFRESVRRYVMLELDCQRLKNPSAWDRKFCETYKSESFQYRDPEYAKRKAAHLLMRMDTATLYNQWYAGGGEVAGIKVPCSDIRLTGPSDLMKPDASWLDRAKKPVRWSDERYVNAAKHLATWDIDFEWTKAQHRAGAEFAKKRCRKRAGPESDDRRLCRAPDEGAGLPSAAPKAPPSEGIR
ncbi:MAG: hypothetical protein KF802_00255 [Bdellovibrionaceae bacterium]|nr:hypothetical protein [Pseudobdellovibrionaceae bacterium]MBX3034802.1 hypothetical protein [Pseudobdellovibrionaceae bacterium]